ncbi:MAG: Hint domain-containing protein [Pseudomonadota bacterium]
MPTTYSDQFFLMDPAVPPGLGTTLTPNFLSLVDQDDDNDVGRFGGDTVNGSDVTRSWPGDTVTISTPSGNITYTGITFYTADGARYFTPTDGQVMQEGTFVSSTFVNTDAPLDVGDLGPSCFTPGTLIATPKGDVPIETLYIGAQVITMDEGAQPIRLILKGSFRAAGSLAPIRFAPGAIGNARALTVSPQHRMLITGWQAELFYGQLEVLVAARHLVNGTTVRQCPGGTVDYIHLLFDRHQIIFGGGVPSESYFPGSAEMPKDQATLAELLTLFPELQIMASQDISTARPVIRRREAQLLAA